MAAKMTIYVIYDSDDIYQEFEGRMSEQAAEARCEVLNERDYPKILRGTNRGTWTWTPVDVEPES